MQKPTKKGQICFGRFYLEKHNLLLNRPRKTIPKN